MKKPAPDPVPVSWTVVLEDVNGQEQVVSYQWIRQERDVIREDGSVLYCVWDKFLVAEVSFAYVGISINWEVNND